MVKINGPGYEVTVKLANKDIQRYEVEVDDETCVMIVSSGALVIRCRDGKVIGFNISEWSGYKIQSKELNRENG